MQKLMRYSYKTKGVCSTMIEFDIEEGKIRNVVFTAGCSGNLKAVSALVEGADAKAAIAALKGIQCGSKSTSCADQFARALETAVEKE